MAYITAAFRSSGKNEAHLFVRKEHVIVNYSGMKRKQVLSAPQPIDEGYPFLKGTTFAKSGIDCAFGSHHKDQAFIFSGKLCAQINYALHNGKGRIIRGPMTITAMFPFFKGTVFENGVDAAFESTKKYEAYLFKDDQYAHINYDYDSHLISKNPINQRFPSLKNTIFKRKIDAAFASHKTDEAYLFKGKYYVRINFVLITKNSNITSDIKEIHTYWPPLDSILPSQRNG